MRQRFASALLVVFCVASLHALLSAQAPHGGAGARLQPGPNINAAGGIVNPGDPAALVKSDILLQRQNETVVAASSRNPDHILAAANDYRFVDFPDDPSFGGGQNFITRLIAKLFRRPLGKPLPVRATGGPVGAWTGVYRSCDRGRTWIGSALPGGPLDNSPASQLPNPLKQLTLDATQAGGHAETTDPFVMAGPGGRMHMVVLGFVRFPDGSVGSSRMFYASYTDRNNLEGGSCFDYDFTRQIDTAAAYVGPDSPSPFIDKPSLAVDKDGMIVISYTVFTDAIKSKIVIARSLDGGATWTKTIPSLNLGFLRNHGTTTTINQVNGHVYVAWRMFYQDWPLMVISRSTDRGKTFLPATPISHWWPAQNFDQIVQQLKAAKLQPFDQFNEPPGGGAAQVTARSLAFPSIAAGVVNGQSRLYAVWQERADVGADPLKFGYPSADGSPRVMFTMSTDGGWSWTPRRAIDAGPRLDYQLPQDPARPSGPQVQPVLSISGTTNPQLLVLYYEAREELAGPPYAGKFISGIERQMDVRSARINPATGVLVAPSVQVAQYAIKANSSPTAELAETAPNFDAVNRSNLTMYGGGTKAFFGDYPHLAASTVFEPATATTWKWATEPASALAIWTDHRDVQFPVSGIDGAWGNYTPINKPIPPGGGCSHVALRNANPYFTEIAGVVAGSPQNFKRLTVQRAFVTYVENRTPQDRVYRLTLVPTSGIQASFAQFSPTPITAIDAHIFGNSSHTQTIWVAKNLSKQTGSVRMTVQEINLQPGQTAYRTSVTLNPDPQNELLTPIPTAVTGTTPPIDGVSGSEYHNPQVSAPQVSAFNIKAPQVSAPQVSAPQVSAPQVSAPQVSAPQVSAPQGSAPQVSATTPDDGNEGTDVTYTVTNAGNTESTYNAFLNVPNVKQMLDGNNYDFQVLITRTSLVPGFLQTATGCVPAAETKVQVIANLQVPTALATQFLAVDGSQTPLATFSVAPAGGATVAASSTDATSIVLPDEVKVTLRAIRLKPLAQIPSNLVFNPGAVIMTVASTSTNVVNGVVQADGTQPVTTAAGLPDLVVANYTAASQGLTAPAGGQVTLSSWRHQNQGSAAANSANGSISNGFYLSTDAVISTADTRLDGNTNTNAVLPAGGGFNWGGPTLTIPTNTPLGSYYIGILVDEVNQVSESNEGNNYVSEPLVVVPSGLRQWSTAAGGNGSFYEYVRQGGLSWTQAEAAARQRIFQGRTGHLVSITSAAENAFANGLGDGGVMRAWIGLYDSDGAGAAAGPWVWSTGESASYFNWNTGNINAPEPNNPGTEFWVEMFSDGTWNNNVDLDPVVGFRTLGYIVEYPPPPTAVSPSTGAPGEGFLVVRGTGFPSPSSGIATVSNGASTANGFVFQSPSTTSAYWVRLPVAFPLGPATIQLSDPNTSPSNAFPITVTATPGTPIITKVFKYFRFAFFETTTVNPGETIYIQADGIDTLGSIVRFQQATSTDVTPVQAVSSQTIGLAVEVTVPSGLLAGPVSVSIRQGASAFSAPVTLTVPALVPVPVQ
ncbi:MAG: hypothetical protein H0W08_26050 [Acidobacteria bacterium]|nr:hypothetical protein [Acidobacteriota bacterium]